MRLTAIGQGWDINVVNTLMSFSSLCNKNTADQYILTANATDIIVSMHHTMEPDELSNCLMKLDQSTREWYILLLTYHIASTQESAHHNDNSTQAYTLTGSQPGGSNVESNTSQCDTGPQTCPHSRRSESELVKDDELKQTAIRAILAAQESMEPDDLARYMMKMDPEVRD